VKRIFIETREFQARWKELGLGDEETRDLQEYLLEHPDSGPLIPGTGGVRKLRWTRAGRGKSGGVRVIYIDMTTRDTIWLITAFGKSEKADLSESEKKGIKSFVKGLSGSMK
jgi:hypothetical protein